MITVKQFLNLAIEDYEVYIYDFNTNENIFEGYSRKIPFRLKNYEVDSWEIYNGKLGLNIDTSEN